MERSVLRARQQAGLHLGCVCACVHRGPVVGRSLDTVFLEIQWHRERKYRGEIGYEISRSISKDVCFWQC